MPVLSNRLVNFVKHLLVFVDGNDMTHFRMQGNQIKVPRWRTLGDIPTRFLWIRSAEIDSPGTITQIGYSVRIQLIALNGMRSLVGMVVIFESDLDPIFVKKRTPVGPYRLCDISVVAGFIRPDGRVGGYVINWKDVQHVPAGCESVTEPIGLRPFDRMGVG